MKEIRIPPTVKYIAALTFGYSNYDAIYYCGDTEFSSTINIFGYPGKNERYFPKKIYVRETYSSEKFGDCTNLLKTNLCSVPIHEPTRCSIKVHTRHISQCLIATIFIISCK